MVHIRIKDRLDVNVRIESQMGASTSKVLNDIGSVIGNIVATPFKFIFGRSCKDVCDGKWDVVCFVEHICIADLVKFLLACCLLYICLIFLYLLYKLGLCQCIAKSLCKMCWAACETSWLTLDYVCCFCWHKIRYTKRVYRGRHRRLRRQLSRDVELGYISTSSTSDGDERGDFNNYGSSLGRKRKSYREQVRRRRTSRCNSVKLKRGGKVSVRMKGGKSHRRRRRRRRRDQLNEVQMASLRKSRRSNSMKFKKQRTR